MLFLIINFGSKLPAAVSTVAFLMWITFIWKVTKTLLSLLEQKRNKMTTPNVIKEQKTLTTEQWAEIEKLAAMGRIKNQITDLLESSFYTA